MSHLRVIFGLLALIVVAQAFTLRDKRKAQSWPSSASSSSSSSSGGLEGPITKTHSQVTGLGKADASGSALGFGPNQYFGGHGQGGPYLPGGPNPSGNSWGNQGQGNNWGLGGQPQGPGYRQQPGQPQGPGYPQQPGQLQMSGYSQQPGLSQGGYQPSLYGGGSGGATAIANANGGGNANAIANAGAGNQYPAGGAIPYTSPLSHGGGADNANAIANAYGGNANANALANANGYGGNANALANANANGGGFGGHFFSRVGEDDEDSKKNEDTEEGAKGVFSTSHASLDKDGKGTFEMTAGKIPENMTYEESQQEYRQILPMQGGYAAGASLFQMRTLRRT